MKSRSYYDFGPLLTRNGTFNFVSGGRGIGKTYGAKKIVIRNAIKRGDQFIYLRRHRTELVARNTFFADIEHEFPEHDFRLNGNVAQFAHVDTRADKRRTWLDMGFFIALSSTQAQKSTAFPKVKWIIYDEFIIEKGYTRYIPDEPTVFTNFYSTVDRYQDKTRALFLSNSVSIMNPYFLEYDIRPDSGKEFHTKQDGFIVAHFPDSKDFNNEIYQTRFGKFIKNTDYAKYAVENEFSDNSSVLVTDKGAKAKYQYTIDTQYGAFSIWNDRAAGVLYAQQRRPRLELVFTLVADNLDENKTLLPKSAPLMTQLRNAFRNGRVLFDSPISRNAFIEVFR